MQALSRHAGRAGRGRARGRLRHRALLSGRCGGERSGARRLPAALRCGARATRARRGRWRRRGGRRWTGRPSMARRWRRNARRCSRDLPPRLAAARGRADHHRDHPARGGARLRGAGHGRRHGAAGGAALAQPARPCRSRGHDPAARLPAGHAAADHPPGRVHVRLGEAGAGGGVAVPQPAPGHDGGRGGGAGDEFPARLDRRARPARRALARRDAAGAECGAAVPVLLHAREHRARRVQPAAGAAARRRADRGRASCRCRWRRPGRGWSGWGSCS